MKKTIKTAYLEERLNRIINEYKQAISREEAENRISRNLESIKTRQAQIDGYRLIILGLEKAENLIIDITK